MTSNELTSIDALLYQLQSETSLIKSIEPAAKVIEFFRNLAKYDHKIKEVDLGSDASGRSIYSYSIGDGPTNILFYAFPDPGEAIGGTGIMALVNLLQKGACCFKSLPVTWHFIPCLNFVDQPDEGKTLKTIMKTRSQEVDWCLNDPRPETTALLNAVKEIKPEFTFALHDEYHCEEFVPPYLGSSHEMKKKTFERICRLFGTFGLKMGDSFSHPELGNGFFKFDSIGEEYLNCTYSEIQKFGPVLIAELSRQPELSDGEIVFLQLASGFIFLNDILNKES